jgi:hypothetical protein
MPGKPKDKQHGLSRSPIYDVWVAMVARCRNKNSHKYCYYGAIGIDVCERWIDFRNFLEDMGIPENGNSLDRIDNEKGYYPDNCRWTNSTTQQFNTKIRIDNTSGIKGVGRIKNGKWVASIYFHGKDKHLGCFARIEDAIQARINAEWKLLNWSPTEKYVTLRKQQERSSLKEQSTKPMVLVQEQTN